MSSTRDLRLQVVLQAIDKTTSVLRKVRGESGGTAKALKETRDRLKQLNAQQRDIDQFRDLRTGLKDTGDKLDAAKARVKQLAQALNQAGPPTKAMVGQLQQAKVAARVLGQQHERQTVQVQTLRDKLGAAGVATTNLSAAARTLRSEQDRLNVSLKTQQDRLNAVAARQKKLSDLNAQSAAWAKRAALTAAAGYAMQAGGSAAVRGAMKPVGSFKAHEDAMLGIARQVPGARGAGGELTDVYRAIQQQVRDLSQEVPLATTQIAEMFTAAARMEVPTDQLKDFTRTAAMMATAFDAIPDEITESMGKVAKNFKMPITQITGLADSINYLDDNAISKGADIIDFLNRVSGTASTVAMTAKDAAALGSTLLTLGERTETAGTATNAMLTKFAAATKGTKKFRSALSEIGISAEALEKGMSTDATKTLLQVIDAIRSLPKDKQLGVMAELVGLEHSDTLAKLADKAEELRRQLQLSNSPAGTGSMKKEADARNNTLSAQQQMFENRVFNLSAAVGDTLKPALEELLKIVNPMLEKFTAWVQKNPDLVAGIMQTAIVLGALVAGVGALLIPLALIGAKVFLLRYLFANMVDSKTFGLLKLLGRALLTVGSVFLRVGLMALASPLVWAIGLMAGAAYLIYNNWEGIVGGLKAIWDDLGGSFTAVLATIGAAILNWSPLGLFYKAFAGVMRWFGVELPATFSQFGSNLIGGLIKGITSMIAPTKAALAKTTAATAGAGVTPASPLRLDARPPLTTGAGRASLAAGGGNHQITLHLAPGMDPHAVSRAVSAELDRRDRAQGAKRRSSLNDLD